MDRGRFVSGSQKHNCPVKTETLLLELELIVKELGYRIRKEKGSFQGGFCVVEGEKQVVMNKNHPSELHVAQIIRFLVERDTEHMFIKPAVRKEMDKWIKKLAG